VGDDGTLVAEYFSVHAVLGRNLNKRGSRGKTSSKLGRGGVLADIWRRSSLIKW